MKPETSYREPLDEDETYWRDRYLWLKERGYLLRPRYHPDWAASWKANKKKDWICEDGQIIDVSIVSRIIFP